jgi:hypothetical protein
LRGSLDFDPARCEYGAATASIRRILIAWASVDWFVAPENDGATRAVRLFEEHNSLARKRMPELFPERIDIHVAHGGWAAFHDLCLRVREPPQSSWDWKFSALKKLSSAHSKEHGWTLADEARRQATGGAPQPGDLFLRIGDHVIWGG